MVKTQHNTLLDAKQHLYWSILPYGPSGPTNVRINSGNVMVTSLEMIIEELKKKT